MVRHWKERVRKGARVSKRHCVGCRSSRLRNLWFGVSLWKTWKWEAGVQVKGLRDLDNPLMWPMSAWMDQIDCNLVLASLMDSQALLASQRYILHSVEWDRQNKDPFGIIFISCTPTVVHCGSYLVEVQEKTGAHEHYPSQHTHAQMPFNTKPPVISLTPEKDWGKTGALFLTSLFT